MTGRSSTAPRSRARDDFPDPAGPTIMILRIATSCRSKWPHPLHEAGKHLAGIAQHGRVVVGDAWDVGDYVLDAGVEQALDAFADLVHPADQELVAELLQAPRLPVRFDRGVSVRAIFQQQHV